MDYLSVKELANLMGVTPRSIQKKIAKGKLEAVIQTNEQNKKDCYMIPVSSLSEDLQAKYYEGIRKDMQLPPAV